MRIGITCYPTYGGSGAVATELGLELGRRGHEVHIISYASPFRLRGFAERVYFHEVDVSYTYPLLEYFPYSLALAVKQHEVAVREELDILHVHYAIPHATAAFLAREMIKPERDLKVITTLHGTDITLVGREQSFKAVTRFSIEKSDAVTAVSEYLKQQTYEAFLCRGCEIEVIPNFVNLDEFYPAESGSCRNAFAPPDTRVLMHISNFRELKRLPDVIATFALIRKEIPAVLILVGDGPTRLDAEADVQRRGLTEHVQFLGKMDTVAELLRSADLFLLPSESESFGLVALEAMACGVPVIASRIGGLPELLEDGGETGALVDLGDTTEMAARGIEFLTDEGKLAAARKAAVEKAKLFASDKIVPRYEELYQRVVGK